MRQQQQHQPTKQQQQQHQLQQKIFRRLYWGRRPHFPVSDGRWRSLGMYIPTTYGPTSTEAGAPGSEPREFSS